MKYPPPEDVAGKPFIDPNFKLSVLGALVDLGVIDLGDPRSLAKHVLRRDVDLEEEGYDLIQPVYEYLTRYPLSPEHLGALEDRL